MLNRDNVGRALVNHKNFIIFSIIVFVSFSLVLHGNAFAETTARSTNFEKTTVIEFENNDNVQIKTVKMWLGKDSGNFKSFKTEKNWIGSKTPQGVLVFSTEEPVKSGESVKFGIKTEIVNPGINWKTIDSSNNDITLGKVVANQITDQQPDKRTDSTSPSNPSIKNNFDSATFRIIPEKPKNGDSIRIVGDGFTPKQSLNFYIDNEKIEDFTADDTGHLVGKAKVPVNKGADRIEFSLVNGDGNKKTVSIRIEHTENQVVNPKIKRIAVSEFPEIVQPGETVHSSGTGKPGSTLTITAKDPAGNKIYEVVVPVDSQGNWAQETVIPPDAGIGSRQVEISDGTEVITRTVSVTILKTVHITPSATQYDRGNTMMFNGTASVGKSVEIVIKDPIGKEVFSDIITADDSGLIKFEFPTDQDSAKGTYVILATQEQDTDIVRVGLGEPPGVSIVAKFTKLNYSTSDKAKMTIQGPAKATVSILIIDPSDKPKVTDSVTLGLDGRKDYEVDLSTYKSGVYSVVVKYQKSQAKEVFTVGLQLGTAGEIKMQATKQVYQQGDAILVLGSAKPNSLLNLKLTSPDGVAVKHKELFTDKNGKFSDSTFRIPADGSQGIWIVRAESGATYVDVKLNIASAGNKIFTISTDKTAPYQSKDTIRISGAGAEKSHSVIVTIFDSNNKKVVELNTFSTSDGTFRLDWPIPADTVSGNYKASAKIGTGIAEITFSIQ